MIAALALLALQQPPQPPLRPSSDVLATATTLAASAALASGETVSILGMTLSFSSAGAAVVSITSGEVLDQGLRVGDLIVMAGGRPVRSEADLSAAIATARPRGAVVLLGVRHRDGSASYISIPTSN